MTGNAAHSYFPDSDALIDRLEALQKAARDYRNAKASMGQQSVEWEQRLGSHDEIAFGLEVAMSTLMMAGDAMSAQELLEAENTNLISAEDMRNLTLARRQSGLQSSRNDQNNDSNQNQRRR
jgi:hypothetical protein